MRMIEWAFEQDIPHASKLILVYLAANGSAEGVGLMNRDDLMRATGYKVRSMQRILRALRNAELLIDIGGPWYRVGPLAPSLDGKSAKLLANEIGELPDDMRPAESVGKASADGLQIHVDTEQIGQMVADSVIDQLANFEARMTQRLDQFAVFHVEQEIEIPPDPAIENPLYEQLIDSGMSRTRAYALSQKDLDMDEELENEAAPIATLGLEELEEEYTDDHGGRYDRILDILHGTDAGTFDRSALRNAWVMLEEDENKHTVNGEPDAFVLIYPAIVEAAKANVGTLTISDFLNRKRIKEGAAPWDREINPIDKDDPALATEISVMLGELEEANDPRCEVQPRTKEIGDDGKTHQETLLGYHRRVSAKHSQMLKLKQMGVV